MSWQSEDMNPGDRVAQAALTLVEQALIADTMKFPGKVNGQIKIPDEKGNVVITAPVVEIVNSKRQNDEEGGVLGPKVYHENIDIVTGANGSKLQTIDEQAQGFVLDVATVNKWDCRTIMRGPDGNLQYQLQGKCLTKARAGKFKDDAYIVFDGKGAQLPLRLELVGKIIGDSKLEIKATTMLADKDGNPTLDQNKQKKVLGSVEMKLSIDSPASEAINFLLTRTGSPFDWGFPNE